MRQRAKEVSVPWAKKLQCSLLHLSIYRYIIIATLRRSLSNTPGRSTPESRLTMGVA
jgi:hypothetical protein